MRSWLPDGRLGRALERQALFLHPSVFAASVSQASYSEGENRQRHGDEQRLDLTFATRNHARSFLQHMVRHPVGCGNEY